jgi:hypothetical protein
MAIKNEFLLGDHQLIHHYVYLLDIFHHLYSQLPQKKLPKGNVIYALIQQDVNNQPNLQDISVRNAMLNYV